MNINVGNIVKACRKHAKMTQKELADVLHTTQATISRMEKNLVAVEVNTFTKIAKATNTQELAIQMLFGMDALTQIVTLVPSFINLMFKIT